MQAEGGANIVFSGFTLVPFAIAWLTVCGIAVFSRGSRFGLSFTLLVVAGAMAPFVIGQAGPPYLFLLVYMSAAGGVVAWRLPPRSLLLTWTAVGAAATAASFGALFFVLMLYPPDGPDRESIVGNTLEGAVILSLLGGSCYGVMGAMVSLLMAIAACCLLKEKQPTSRTRR